MSLYYARFNKVDAFLVTAVGGISTETTGAWGMPISGIYFGYPFNKNTANIEVAVISAESGRPLMQAAAFGSSENRSKQGLIADVLRQILDRAFNDTFWKERNQR